MSISTNMWTPNSVQDDESKADVLTTAESSTNTDTDHLLPHPVHAVVILFEHLAWCVVLVLALLSCISILALAISWTWLFRVQTCLFMSMCITLEQCFLERSPVTPPAKATVTHNDGAAPERSRDPTTTREAVPSRATSKSWPLPKSISVPGGLADATGKADPEPCVGRCDHVKPAFPSASSSSSPSSKSPGSSPAPISDHESSPSSCYMTKSREVGDKPTMSLICTKSAPSALTLADRTNSMSSSFSRLPITVHERLPAKLEDPAAPSNGHATTHDDHEVEAASHTVQSTPKLPIELKNPTVASNGHVTTHNDQKVEAVSHTVQSAPQLPCESHKAKKRQARACLQAVWWEREKLRKQIVSGNWMPELLVDLEAKTAEHNDRRTMLASLMANGQLNEEDGKVFPKLAKSDLRKPKFSPAQPK